jgi:protein PhnA
MSDDDQEITKDCNGTQLHDGDTVHIIKDLKVKGTNTTLKQGTKVKGIRLTGNPDEVECRVENIKGLVLKTAFLKRVNS